MGTELGVQSSISQPKIFGTKILEFQFIIQWSTYCIMLRTYKPMILYEILMWNFIQITLRFCVNIALLFNCLIWALCGRGKLKSITCSVYFSKSHYPIRLKIAAGCAPFPALFPCIFSPVLSPSWGTKISALLWYEIKGFCMLLCRTMKSLCMRSNIGWLSLE